MALVGIVETLDDEEVVKGFLGRVRKFPVSHNINKCSARDLPPGPWIANPPSQNPHISIR